MLTGPANSRGDDVRRGTNEQAEAAARTHPCRVLGHEKPKTGSFRKAGAVPDHIQVLNFSGRLFDASPGMSDDAKPIWPPNQPPLESAYSRNRIRTEQFEFQGEVTQLGR